MAFIDYYKILGVKKDIPQKDVRAAYRKRAKQFHPDLHPNDPKAKAKFQALSEAYEVIGDPDKRAKYDKYGEQWRNADAFEQSGGGEQGYSNYNTAFDFSGMGGGFSSFFQDLFGGGAGSSFNRRTSYRKPAPRDREVELGIDLYTALLGGEVVVMLPEGRKIKLKVKPYTQDGTKVRIKGKDGSVDTILTYRVKLPTSLTENQKEHLRQMRDNA